MELAGDLLGAITTEGGVVTHLRLVDAPRCDEVR
jgi:hypothetical protein